MTAPSDKTQNGQLGSEDVTDSSGNVFADLGLSEPALRLENARLRARVIELEDRLDLAESYPLGTAKEPK
jgi:hypothetical protein